MSKISSNDCYSPSTPCPRSGSVMRCTRTLGPKLIPVMSCGVMSTYCFLSDAFAVSIYTPEERTVKFCKVLSCKNAYHHFHTDTPIDGVHEYVKFIWRDIALEEKTKQTVRAEFYLPRQRKGQPIESQRDSKKQMVEKDFSPPLNERGSFSIAP
jgi:hypothetical protein